MQLRIATFNVENMYNRYVFLDRPWNRRNYEDYIRAVGITSIANREGELISYTTTNVQRNNTGLAIEDAAPDILAIQEVENLDTLRNFNSEFLNNYFQTMIVLDGNDSRGINVGLMLKAGLAVESISFRTNIDVPEGKDPVRREPGGETIGALFSRDCLEADVKLEGSDKVLTLLVNHLKSQAGGKPSQEKRQQQADYVAKLAKQRQSEGKYPIVLGDLNADPIENPKDDSLNRLLNLPILTDVFAELPESERWTHYYAAENSVSRLDYILVDQRLPIQNTAIIRKGLSTKARKFYKGDRYPTIGAANTEASDHCPIVVAIEV